MGNPAQAPMGLLKPTPDPFEQLLIDHQRDSEVMLYFCHYSFVLKNHIDQAPVGLNELLGSDERSRKAHMNNRRAYYGIEQFVT